MAMAGYNTFERLCLGSGLWPDQGILELCGWSGRVVFSDDRRRSYPPWASSDSVSRKKGEGQVWLKTTEKKGGKETESRRAGKREKEK